MSSVLSPCISVCRIDQKAGLCEGCYRTLDEIAVWPELPDAQRRQIIREARQRNSLLAFEKQP